MIKKVLAYGVIIIVLVVIAGLSYVTLALPNVGDPENIKVELTPARVARGEYLANHVGLCTDCHSKRDWNKLAGPMTPGTGGGGGEVFNGKVGFPGEVHVPNITPYKLSAYTDGELFRAITTGERKDGSAIFPLMPWPYYSKLSREDVYAIIAYIRTLKPIKADYAKSRLNFPLNIIVHTMPKKATLGELPSAADTLKYGAYMCNASGCVECHTKADNGQIIKGMEFAGGREFLMDGIIVRSANITPEKTTGIGKWKEADFVQMFKSFKDPAKAPAVTPGSFQTIMPWYDYSGMSDTDLKAIFKYLQSVKPIKNTVIGFQQLAKSRN